MRLACVSAVGTHGDYIDKFCVVLQPARMEITSSDGHRVEARTQACLEGASGRPIDEAAVRAAVGQLGDTVLFPDSFDMSGIDFGAGNKF
jgi:hypothetical protein